jgi:hypothetical protein
MKARGRKPIPLNGRGEIRADAIYPVGVLLRRMGIGRNTLTSLRRRGLPIHQLGRRCSFVFGAELIDFLRASQDQGSNDPLAHTENSEDLAATVPGDSTQDTEAAEADVYGRCNDQERCCWPMAGNPSQSHRATN